VCAASWGDLEKENPELADFGRERLDGRVAYLATTSATGQPRASAVTPIVGLGGCFIFVEPGSSKNADLVTDSRYSLHCGVSDITGSSGEFQLAGRAVRIDDDDRRNLAESVSSYKPARRTILYELHFAEVIATSWRGGRADRQKWSSG
jgi:hypothetical protein